MRAVQEQGLAAVLARGARDGPLPWAEPAPDARSIRTALDRAFDDQIRGIATMSAQQVVDSPSAPSACPSVRALTTPEASRVGLYAPRGAWSARPRWRRPGLSHGSRLKGPPGYDGAGV